MIIYKQNIENGEPNIRNHYKDLQDDYGKIR